jgi:hypothetical protein
MDTMTLRIRARALGGTPRARARCGGRGLARAAAAATDAAADAADAADANNRALLSQGWPNALALPATAPHRPDLPSFFSARNYVNLSAGAEALGSILPTLAAEPRFCRITSTACEQGQLARTLAEVCDASLLMDLALGERDVIVWDCGSRKGRRRRRKGQEEDEDEDADESAASCPRALWYGLEFARWALTTLWFDDDKEKDDSITITTPHRPPYLRGFNVERDFAQKLREAPPAVVKRAAYFGRFVPEERRRRRGTNPFALRLYGCYAPTDHDGDAEYCAGLVRGFGSKGRAAVVAAAVEKELDAEARARRLVVHQGWRIFAGGVGHEEMATLLRL